MGKMILASSSPRRAEILKDYKLEIIPSPYVEQHTKTAFSYSYVEDLAYNKALAVVPLVEEESLIIGADTVVILGDEILEKPQDEKDAFLMLKKLSGKTHSVVTSIAIINSKTKEHKINSTTSNVTFKNLSDELIENYIRNFKPLDKAGSYGIQELPDGFIEKVEGDLENIIGISSKSFENLLNEF
ncbi:MAG: septum formation protein Maf [Cyanobacteria bacterium SIG32]|nr:septum formation protein Maf [Cyanobacteria bacterium SIG32]